MGRSEMSFSVPLRPDSHGVYAAKASNGKAYVWHCRAESSRGEGPAMTFNQRVVGSIPTALTN
jgi:hypothetical protein